MGLRLAGLLLLALLLPSTAARTEDYFSTSSYVPVPAGMPVTVLGPDRSLDDVELAEHIRRMLRERRFIVVEEEVEKGLLLTFTRECTLPPVRDRKLGVGVGVLATEHGVSTDIGLDARIVAPSQGAPEPRPEPVLRIDMRLTGTGPKPVLYWVGEVREPLGRKCSAALSPELAERLVEDLAARRTPPGDPLGD